MLPSFLSPLLPFPPLLLVMGMAGGTARTRTAGKGFNYESRSYIDRSGKTQPMDAIWSAAQVSVFVGGSAAAKDSELPEKVGLVVNCARATNRNKYEGDGRLKYIEAPIEKWAGALQTESEKVRGELSNVLLEIHDCAHGRGESVLLHCSFGKHRSGSLAVAFLMWVRKFDGDTASDDKIQTTLSAVPRKNTQDKDPTSDCFSAATCLDLAHQKRPTINPQEIKSIPLWKLLLWFEEELRTGRVEGPLSRTRQGNSVP